MAKKLHFYLVHDSRSFRLGEEGHKCYVSNLDAMFEVIQNMLLDGADNINIFDLGEHDLKF